MKKLYNIENLNEENLIKIMKMILKKDKENQETNYSLNALNLMSTIIHYNIFDEIKTDIKKIVKALENYKDNTIIHEHIENVLENNKLNCKTWLSDVISSIVHDLKTKSTCNVDFEIFRIENLIQTLSQLGYECIFENKKLKLIRNNRQSCINYLSTYYNENQYDYENMTYKQLQKEAAQMREIS
jgi:hypothetical protein